MADYIVGKLIILWEAWGNGCTYVDCVLYNWFTVLDNETKVRVMQSLMLGECEGLRANATSNIDDQRALGVPKRSLPMFQTLDRGVQKSCNPVEPSRMASRGFIFFTLFMAAPNRVRRDLLPGPRTRATGLP